jgi:hypothetical protein
MADAYTPSSMKALPWILIAAMVGTSLWLKATADC